VNSSELAAPFEAGLKISNREDPVRRDPVHRRPGQGSQANSEKWSRVMRHPAAYKSDSEALDQFIRRKGGINAYAARFSRRLGRGRAAW
jgi:hypothetical protein